MPVEEEKQSWVEQLVGLFSPSEAEASPVGTLIKAGAKAAVRAKGPVSSAAKVLIGKRLPSFANKAIKNVTKGRGDWRYIILEDDSVVPVTKDVLNDLIRAHGTETYVSSFFEKGSVSRLEQAYRSLEYHRSRIYPGTTQKTLADWYKKYKANIEQLGVEAPEMVIVKDLKGPTRVPFTMPKVYAEILEKEGAVKILKGLE